MAKAQTKKPVKIDWKGYHKINLTGEDELLFEAWALSQTIQLTDFEAVVNSGYKFSLNWDNYHEGYSASMYCTDKKKPQAGYTLSAWAADAETAVKLLFFKHFIMAKEDWELTHDNPDKNLSKYG